MQNDRRDSGWVITDGKKDSTDVPLLSTPVNIFYKAALAKGRNVEILCPQNEPARQAVLKAYGAIYVASEELAVPANCLPTQAQVYDLSRQPIFRQLHVKGILVRLQTPALDQFYAATIEALHHGLSLSPRGLRASLRSYDDTRNIWYRNLGIGIRSTRAISRSELTLLRSPDIRTSIDAVLAIEKRGTLLGSAGGKSIIQIAAPTGTSQHVAGLAIDIEEHGNANVRAIMEKHGFFQTVFNDFTHFTFLGCNREDLTNLGLVERLSAGRPFYVPKL